MLGTHARTGLRGRQRSAGRGAHGQATVCEELELAARWDRASVRHHCTVLYSYIGRRWPARVAARRRSMNKESRMDGEVGEWHCIHGTPTRICLVQLIVCVCVCVCIHSRVLVLTRYV